MVLSDSQRELLFWLLKRSKTTSNPFLRGLAAQVRRFAAGNSGYKYPLSLNQWHSLDTTYRTWKHTQELVASVPPRQPKKPPKTLLVNGEEKTVKQIAADLGCSPLTIYQRIRAGWKLEEVVAIKPLRRQKAGV